MEGILTCIIAVVGYIILVPFPEQARGAWKFLSDAEVEFCVARIEHDSE